MKNKILVFLFLMIYSSGGFSQVISDFEGDNTDGWVSEGDGVYYYEATTGNPGGCFRVDDDATGDINYSFAPLKFLGNWSSATAILSPNPPYKTWKTYKVSLSPTDWQLNSGTWSGLMQQVTTLIVTMEFISGDEFNRLDNVKLSFSPVAVPVNPVVCSGFEEGNYDGWTFTGSGGVSNQTSGSLLLNNAFLQISGPGGVARIPMDSAVQFSDPSTGKITILCHQTCFRKWCSLTSITEPGRWLSAWSLNRQRVTPSICLVILKESTWSVSGREGSCLPGKLFSINLSFT